MTLKFVDILNIISLFQLALFIIFLASKIEGRNKVSTLLLISFFFVQFMSIFNHFIISQSGYFINVSPHIFYIGVPFTWLWAPLLFIYVRSLIFSDFRFKWSQIFHLVPFIAFLLFDIIQFHLRSSSEKIDLIKVNRLITPELNLLFNILIMLQIFIYLLLAIIYYNRYNRKIREQQSSIDLIQLNWIRFVIYGYFVAFIITDLCRLGLHTLPEGRDYYIFMSFFGMFVYFVLLFYRAISFPEIFTRVNELQEPKQNMIPKHEALFLLPKIRDYMEAHEPYLNPELTLKDLSLGLKIPERLLSGVINQYNNQNFYDFINSYRVEKAKRLLENNEKVKKTIQEILWESGFNSKSTFNLAFKKSTGLTPTEYRKRKPAV